MEETHVHGTDVNVQPTRLQHSLVVFIIGLLIEAVIVGLAWQGTGTFQGPRGGAGRLICTLKSCWIVGVCRQATPS